MCNGILLIYVNSVFLESCGKGILVELGDCNIGKDGECVFYNIVMIVDKLEDFVILRNEDYKSVVEDIFL